MKANFQIGSARAVRGERVYGDVEVSRRVDGTPISIPVILVQGEKPGPVLCLNGGIHGDEFAGMAAITRLAHDIDPAELRGTLVAVPVVNQPAFEDACFTNHYDHVNLNRTFPGSPTGSLTNKIAHTFLIEIVLKCNAMVDLHGGGGYAHITKVVIAQGGYEELAWELALASGFNLVWVGGRVERHRAHLSAASGHPSDHRGGRGRHGMQRGRCECALQCCPECHAAPGHAAWTGCICSTIPCDQRQPDLCGARWFFPPRYQTR